MKLSIVIVNWKTKELTAAAIASVFAQTKALLFEVILIDNNSGDGSVEALRAQFPQISIIVNDHNLGFGRANNQGMRQAKGQYIMLLNSDTVVLDHALEKMVSYLDKHADAMMIGPKVLNSDGTFQHACRRMLPTPLSSFYHLFGLVKIFRRNTRVNAYKGYNREPNVTEPVEALSGAAMMFRREVFEATGGFDERFFMYGEDLDLCKQVFDRGWKTVFLHTAEIIHYGGASSKKRRTQSIVNFYDAMWLYYYKHFKETHNFFLQKIIWLGIKMRLMIALLQNTFKFNS